MKITELQLEKYGIYKDILWKPAVNELNVIMGANESGKTTLLRFIRDMIFGYNRGKWQGKSGNMSFIRNNGDKYRVYRTEKEKWFLDSEMKKNEDELPLLWWHGLNRKMYENIFAIGLEDLQGATFLSDNAVRSRFFMLQGGDKISNVKKIVKEEMENIFISSPQGKRKINSLLNKLHETEEELDKLSLQEKDFSDLQKKQELLNGEISELKNKLEYQKKESKKLEKRLGAWEYYKRVKALKKQIDLSEKVKVFPSNGKEQWNRLMNDMKVIHEQQEALKVKLSEYKPYKKEEIVPLVNLQDKLEKLYINLGQWQQTINDAEELKNQKSEWKIQFMHLGYDLSLWDTMLNPEKINTNVDWEEGRRISQSVIVRDNELHFWKQREPEVETIEPLEPVDTEIITEEDWKNFENKANKIETFVDRKKIIKDDLQTLNEEKEHKFTIWFWIGTVLLLFAILSLAAFYTSFIGVFSIYIAIICIICSGAAFIVNRKKSHSKRNKQDKFNKELLDVEEKIKILGSEFPGKIPESEEDMIAFHNMMQEKRADFYKNQLKRQANLWKKETIKKQELEYNKWIEEGKELKELDEEIHKDWKAWLLKYNLPECKADDLSKLQEQWQKIYSIQGKGKILDVKIEQIEQKLSEFKERAAVIIKATGKSCEVIPAEILQIYEENRRCNLEWQSVFERNKQHLSYKNELEKLNEKWNKCQESMQSLFKLVNAENAEEFAARVNAYEKQDQIMKEWNAVRQDLRLYAGSEEEFNKLWGFLEKDEYEKWMKEYKLLEESTKKGNEKLGNMQMQAGAVENEIFRLAEDESMTTKLQEKKEIESKILHLLEEWITYFYIDKILEIAQKKYETGKQPKVMEQANLFLNSMTRGKYSILLDDKGKSIKIIDYKNQIKESKIWSSGTGDQVYLAIRLALALAFGEQVESLPIVLDDIFVRFDEERQKETLKFLMELGKKQQIFLFTCHKQTMRIAEEIGRERNSGLFTYINSGVIN